MAVIFCRSTDGNNGDDGSTWALAKATLAAALTAAGAGGTVYVSDNHAETQATTMSLTSPGTAASPVRVLCVDDSAEPPTALATTGTVSTTGTNGINFSGFAYCYGLTFNYGTGGSGITGGWFDASSAWWWRLEACKLVILNSSAGTDIFVGANTSGTEDDQLLELINTTVAFGGTGQNFIIMAPFRWLNTPSAIAGATLPTTLFGQHGGASGRAEISGVDLSALGSGNNLVDVAGACFDQYRFENCKLGASVAIVTGTHPGQGGAVVDLVNCDSADTNYRYYKRRYQGEIFQETTIVLDGGPSDGTTNLSRKVVSSANAKFFSPLISDPIVKWNETTGSALTATVEIVTDNVTLTDAECWLEIEYLGTSGFPLSSLAHDRAANILATAANQATSSVTWTTTGLTTPVKQKLEVTFTPQEKGPIKARVMLAKASTTVYFAFDPDSWIA